MRSSWIIPEKVPNIQSGDLHIWRAHLSADLLTGNESLSEDERLRMHRFKFSSDRRKFAQARNHLRHILGGYLHMAPGEIEFRYTAHGKPYLPTERDEGQLQFNISHAGDIMLAAFVMRIPVGVDVEQIKPLPELEQIATQFFSAEEQQDLNLLSGPEKLTAFYHCWARKEAVVKACGEGLSMPLDSFQVSLLPGEPAVILRSPNPGPWMLQELTPEIGYAAAVAAPVDRLVMHLFSLEENTALLL